MENIMTVRVPESLQQILSQNAKELGLTRNSLVINILWDWVKQNEKTA